MLRDSFGLAVALLAGTFVVVGATVVIAVAVTGIVLLLAPYRFTPRINNNRFGKCACGDMIVKQNKTVSVVLQRKRWIAASRIQQQSGRGQSVVSYTGLVERYCHPHVHLRSGRDFVGATSVLVDKDRTGNEKRWKRLAKLSLLPRLLFHCQYRKSKMIPPKSIRNCRQIPCAMTLLGKNG